MSLTFLKEITIVTNALVSGVVLVLSYFDVQASNINIPARVAKEQVC